MIVVSWDYSDLEGEFLPRIYKVLGSIPSNKKLTNEQLADFCLAPMVQSFALHKPTMVGGA